MRPKRWDDLLDVVWLLVFVVAVCILSAVGCGGKAPLVTERVVVKPEKVRCDVPIPQLPEVPVLRKCGEQLCWTPAEAHTAAEVLEKLLSLASEYALRCAQ